MIRGRGATILVNMARNPDLRRQVNKISWGLIETLSGLLLYSLSFGVTSITTSGGKSSRTAGKMFAEADRLSDHLFAAFDPSQFRSAFQNLKRKGLINTIKGRKYEATITKQGLKQLEEDIPLYRIERPWDKRVYLVSYDIEESEKDVRDKLRKFLEEIKCAPLHQSLYLAIYNPRGLLRTWVRSYLRSGEILVSDIGPDGALGDQPLEHIIADAYNLTKVNLKYAAFLHDFPSSTKNHPHKRLQAFFNYNAILQQDPQLPFKLLPDWWLGDKAWRRYQKITGKI